MSINKTKITNNFPVKKYTDSICHVPPFTESPLPHPLTVMWDQHVVPHDCPSMSPLSPALPLCGLGKLQRNNCPPPAPVVWCCVGTNNPLSWVSSVEGGRLHTFGATHLSSLRNVCSCVLNTRLWHTGYDCDSVFDWVESVFLRRAAFNCVQRRHSDLETSPMTHTVPRSYKVSCHWCV